MMGSNLPAWVTPVAWTFLVLAVLSATAIAVDIYGRGRRQPSRAMEIVWPVTALYLGPFALWAYSRWDRRSAHPDGRPTRSSTPVVTFGLPGGAASVTAHLAGVPLVVLTGWTIAGLNMWAMVAVIAVLALVMLFGFEYASRAGATARLATAGRAGTAPVNPPRAPLSLPAPVGTSTRVSTPEDARYACFYASVDEDGPPAPDQRVGRRREHR